MTRTDANKQIVEQFITALFTDGDLTAVDRYLDPGFINQDPPFPGTPLDAEGMRQTGAMFRREHRPFGLTALAVHGVMTGVTDAGHQARLNSFDMVTADGQPVRWALNLLHGAGLSTGSAAPELVMRNLPRMAREGLPVYLYGSPW